MKFSSRLLAGAVLAFSVLPLGEGFFRVFCSGPLVRDRTDPIVNFGGVSRHLHTVSGGSGFDPHMNYSSAVNSKCTSCNVKEDKSNYWTPDLWVRAKNGSFHPVRNGGHTIYYLQRRANDAEKVLPFPKHFRVIAGNPFLRSYDAKSHAQRAVQFSCLNGPTKERTPNLPPYQCRSGIRADIVFPSCWNGQHLGGPHPNSHMAYPDGVDIGTCPPSHPKRLPTLFMELHFSTQDWVSEWVGSKHPFVFSHGDPTGYGYHGDFLNGWELPALTAALKYCDEGVETIEQCSVLTRNLPSVATSCHISPRVDEETEGWLPKLPGCNPIQVGPKDALPAPTCNAPQSLSPPKTFSSDLTAKGWKYVGCALDSISDRVLPFQRTDKNDMTIDKCILHCGGLGYKLAGLQYSKECYCGNKIAESKIGPNANCHMHCAGNSKQYCGGPEKLSVYKKME